MAVFTLSSITIPTPQPYERSSPTQNSENFYFAMLQILSGLKSDGFKFGDIEKETKDGVDIKTAINGITLSVSPTDLTALVAAVQDLKFNGETLDLGPLKITFTGKQITVLTT